MLSIPDMAILGAVALMIFGPEQLPRVARKAGGVMRDIQNTSQSFIREMERAADMHDLEEARAKEPPAYDPLPYEAAPYEEPPAAVAFPAIDGPAPDPERPHAEPPVAEKLAEPRPAPEPSAAGPAAAHASPEVEHPTHL